MKREVSQRISREKECDENGFVGTISFPRWEFNIQMLGKLGGNWTVWTLDSTQIVISVFNSQNAESMCVCVCFVYLCLCVCVCVLYLCVGRSEAGG